MKQRRFAEVSGMIHRQTEETQVQQLRVSRFDAVSHVEMLCRFSDSRKVLHVGCIDGPMDRADDELLHVQLGRVARELHGSDRPGHQLDELRRRVPGVYWKSLPRSETYDIVLVPGMLPRERDAGSLLKAVFAIPAREYVFTVPNCSSAVTNWDSANVLTEGTPSEAVAQYSPYTLFNACRPFVDEAGAKLALIEDGATIVLSAPGRGVSSRRRPLTVQATAEGSANDHAPSPWRLLNSRGMKLYKDGAVSEAVDAFRRAVQLKPDYARAHNNLGNVLTELGQLEDAERHCREAIRIQPNYAIAQNNLGNVLLRQERPGEAAECYQQAIDVQPDYVLAHCNLGRAFDACKDREQAESAWRKAVSLEPDRLEALCGLGNSLLELDRPEEAEPIFRTAIDVDYESAHAWNDLGLAQIRMGQVDEAVACYTRAVELGPDEEPVHRNLGYAYLIRGDYEQAWPHWEWRWHETPAFDPPLTQPRWDGSPLDGRTLLLHAEQGLGDTIQFVRFIQRIPRGTADPGKVILACQPPLVPLLSTCDGIDVLLSTTDCVPDCDVHAPLMSVPAILNVGVDQLLDGSTSIRARSDLRDQWRQELLAYPGFRIGIAWQGNPDYVEDRLRSFPLKHFGRLAEIDGVSLFSLQHGHGTEQLDEVNFPVVNLGKRLDRNTGAFEETAAVMSELDLVICCDTSCGHVAGSLGVPVWMPLTHSPDWRHVQGRDDSVWYPNHRLFRQTQRGNWDEAFERMAVELQELIVARRSAA